MGYDSINRMVLKEVPTSAQSILDLGCGGGLMGSLLREQQECRVVGVTQDQEEAQLALTRLDQIIVADLNNFEPESLGRFDCIICSHVLEHLYQPEQLLKRLHSCLKPDGCLIVALPNVLFWKQRLLFLRGQFRYTTGGLMDRTHYRFYDWDTAHELLRLSGYRIIFAHADGGFPLSRLLPSAMHQGLDALSLHSFPGLLGWQFIFRCCLDLRASDCR